jgi:N-acetylglucosaminyldiphosphoundecaprenol N-acetyl-beta-D-mannosaminyltransferase
VDSREYPDPGLSRSGLVNGVRVDGLGISEVVHSVLEWTNSDSPHLAVGVNAHLCNQAAVDHALRDRVNAADLAYADGQSVVWAANALGIKVPERVATTDLVFPLVDACAREGKKLFLFGGKPGVAAAAADRLTSYAPGLRVRAHDGYLPAARMGEVIDSIQGHQTDVLLVGLGDPLQQEWVATYRDRLRVPAILTCGGLFDWTSGHMRRAPKWMIRAGLEWLWRLRLEPSRLAERYLVGNPLFMWRFVQTFASVRSQNLKHRIKSHT